MKALLLFLLIPLMGFSQYTESDWEERDAWMKVTNLLDLVQLKAGQKVADIGCHEGYLSVHLSKRVGAKGQVFAVDVRNDRLEKLKENLKERKIKNVEVVLGDYDNPKLPDATLDVVIILDTYHEISDYETVLRHVNKALKPGGQILILEKLKDRAKGKSREAHVSAHSMAPKYVKKELKKAGFTITQEVPDFGDWKRETDKQMWILVAEK